MRSSPRDPRWYSRWMPIGLPTLRGGGPRTSFPSWKGDRFPARLRAAGFGLVPQLHDSIESQLKLAGGDTPARVELSDEQPPGGADTPASIARQKYGSYIARAWRHFLLSIAAETLHGVEAVARHLRYGVLREQSGIPGGGVVFRHPKEEGGWSEAVQLPLVDAFRAVLRRLLAGQRQRRRLWHWVRLP